MSIRTIGKPDAFCTFCKREVVADADLACPDCGLPVDERSLAKVPTVRQSDSVVSPPTPMRHAESDASASESGRGGAQVTLPAIREALAWDRATEALIAALEHEEAAALSAYEAAKERTRTARRAAGAMRQLRGLVSVETGTMSLAVPKKAAVKPVAVDGEKPWSRLHAACINCGTTEQSGAGKHAAKGRCFRCDGYFRTHNVERPRELWEGQHEPA